MAESATAGPSSKNAAGDEAPTPVARLSDSDISQLATEAVMIMDRRSDTLQPRLPRGLDRHQVI